MTTPKYHTVRYLPVLMALILLSSFIRVAFADPDVVAQNYAVATAPGIQSCTKGYSLLSGDVGYSTLKFKDNFPIR